jgi:calcineurin-like phosphoesterase family protein
MTAWLEDLRARLQLAPPGSTTLLLGVVDADASLEQTRRLLLELLQLTPLSVADLGAGTPDTGPARWAELTRSRPADVYVLTAAPASPLGLRPMATLYNAERELLRQLAGPVVLLVSRATERAIRQYSPDFFTWAAHSYELPGPRELSALAKQAGVSPAIAEPPEPVEEPIRFLHISDIHLRPQIVKRYDQDRVLRGLVEFLANDRTNFPLDLVFVTGDLANAGKADEYVLVVELLKKLMEVTGVPAEHMFVVPGNHDVDRDVGRWLLRTLDKDEAAVAFFEEAKNRAFHLKKLEAYAESMRALFGERRPLGLAVGEEAVELVEVRGARLAMASFNSAWFAQGDDDRGKLWLGEPNVDRAGQRVADLEAPFAVALMHHPFGELHDVERDNVEHYVERSFDMVVRGHLHKEKTRAIATQRGGYVELAGPAVYQGSQWPNGCFLGEIRPKARTVRLRPYAYASSPDGWVLDSKVFPDDEKDGYCHTFAVAEKRRTKGAVTRRLEQVAEEAVRTASPAQQRRIAEELGIAKPGEKAPSDMAQQTVKAARIRAVDPVLVQGILRSVGMEGGVVVLTMLRELGEGSTLISTADPEYLEHALLRVGRAFLRARATLGLGSIKAEVAVMGIFAALAAMLDPPSAGQAQQSIFVGPTDRPAVVYVPQPSVPQPQPPRPARHRDADRFSVPQASVTRRQQAIATRLRELDQYFSGGHYTNGALVLLDALASTETEPQLEHVKTPAGRDVLLLRL